MQRLHVQEPPIQVSQREKRSKGIKKAAHGLQSVHLFWVAVREKRKTRTTHTENDLTPTSAPNAEQHTERFGLEAVTLQVHKCIRNEKK